MFVKSSSTKYWENIAFEDSYFNETKGTLFFRYTDIGAVLVVVKKENLEEFKKSGVLYESNPLNEEISVVNGNIVIDLLFYTEFSIMKEPIRVNFADTTKEYGICITFNDYRAQNDFFLFLKSYLTVEIPKLPGFFRITRFLPPFSSQILKTRRNSVAQRVDMPDISDDDKLNLLISFQQSLTPHYKFFKPNRPLCDETVKLNTVDEIKNALMNFTLRPEMVFDVWLKLLYLPQIEDFKTKLMGQYLTVKKQWTSLNESQIKRSTWMLESIKAVEKATNDFESQQAIPRELSKCVFDILMTIGHIDSNYYNFLDKIVHIMQVIIYKAKPVFNKDGTVIIEGKTVGFEHFESIVFWIILKLLMRGELSRLFPISMEAPQIVFEPISFFLERTCPYLLNLLCEFGFFDLTEVVPYVLDLFSSFFDYDQTVELWTAAMCSSSLFEFFISFVICCLVFNAHTLLYEDRRIGIKWVELIKIPIDQFGLKFLISAAIQLTNSLRDLMIKF